MDLKNFGYLSYMFFRGCVSEKPIVSNDVCSYTVLAVRVVVQGPGRAVRRYSLLTLNKCALMIDEEYTICLRFQREKRYSPLMCRKQERIVGYDSYCISSLYVCCGRSKVHSRYRVSVMKKILIPNFFNFDNTFYVEEDAVAPPKVEVDTTVDPWW